MESDEKQAASERNCIFEDSSSLEEVVVEWN
jgi:hypothetical protein